MDLSGVGELEAVRHSNPSTLGTDTLFKSRGQISGVFLRGCGLQDWEIKLARLYDPSLTAEEAAEIGTELAIARGGDLISYYSAFISYSGVDRVFAQQLHEALQARGIRCWLDEHEVLPGDDVRESVTRGIRLWDKFLLCASEASLSSWWVDRELEAAFDKEERLSKQAGRSIKAVIPLDLDGYFKDWDGRWATALRARRAPPFTPGEDFDAQLDVLVRALRADDFARRPPPEQKLLKE